MKKPFLYLICIISFVQLKASSITNYQVNYDKELAHILYFISDMQLDTAQLMLKKYALEHPKNLAVLHLESYVDFYKIFINERIELIDDLEQHKSSRLELIKEKLLDEDPFKKHLVTELNLQWSLIHAKLGHNYKAAVSLYKSWRALSNNRQNHPDFIFDKKPASLIFSLVGAVDLPFIVKKLFGIKGSVTDALTEIDDLLNTVSSENYIFHEEAEAIKICILFFQANQQDEAWDFVEKSNLYNSDSVLSKFLLIQLAQKKGDNNFALMLLEDLGDKEDYDRMPYMEFLWGLCKIRQLDTTCVSHFKNYIQKAHGLSGIKEAYQKLAWSSAVFEDDSIQYFHYLNKISSHGSKISEVDMQAQLEYENNKYPDVNLLRARLLSDGGYPNLALISLVSTVDSISLSSEKYLYRKARIYQELENYKEALACYSAVLQEEKNMNSYIKCNSELQKGLIYECLNEIGQARVCYENCLEIESDIYQRSLHQKARTALLRIKKW